MLHGNWLSKSRQAGELLSRGQFERSIEIYSEVAKVFPLLPEAHNNLGVALRASGEINQAIKSYQKAVKLNPNYTIARKNLARALWQIQKIEEALSNYIFILKNSPLDSQVVSEAVYSISHTRFNKPSAKARNLLLLLFSFQNVEYQRLAFPAIKLIEMAGRFEKIPEFEKRNDYENIRYIRSIADSLRDQLLINVLTWTIIPSVSFEKWAVIARRELLFALNKGEAISIDAETLWALTLQFQLTEFVQVMASSEKSLARQYKDRGDLDNIKSLAIIAMYIPLNEIESEVVFWDSIHKNLNTPNSLRLSIEREVFNREREKSIEKNIVSLTPVENTVSEAVKKQYERNPYPRWLSVEITKSRGSFKTKIQYEVKNFRPSNLDLENPDILIAGCGTGRHALSTANRYFGSKVMAIDLSRASLAFAIRQAEAYEQTNLFFYQADILKLGGLKERFDVIEVSGVLHHMEQPLKGWKVLRNLLKPNGLMRVGLYSMLAREKWSNLRSLTPKRISNSGPEDFIRRSRAKVIQKVRNSQDQSLFDTADFYSVSGCRDFLFHENEVQLTIEELKSCLTRLNLRFLGFVNLSEITKSNFSRKFGKQANLLDLNQWEKFEDQFPNTFVTMYQFWCQDVS